MLKLKYQTEDLIVTSTAGQTNERTDRRTDTISYIDAYSHLKSQNNSQNSHFYDVSRLCPKFGRDAYKLSTLWLMVEFCR